MKRLSMLFLVVGLLFSNVMCAVVAYQYRAMICGIEHKAYSAPAHTAFIYAIPFAAGMVICAALTAIFYKKR